MNIKWCTRCDGQLPQKYLNICVEIDPIECGCRTGYSSKKTKKSIGNIKKINPFAAKI